MVTTYPKTCPYHHWTVIASFHQWAIGLHTMIKRNLRLWTFFLPISRCQLSIWISSSIYGRHLWLDLMSGSGRWNVQLVRGGDGRQWGIEVVESILVLLNGKVGVGIRFSRWMIGNWLCINVGLWAHRSLLVLWSGRLPIYLWCSKSWSFEASDGEYYKWKLNGNSSWVSIQPCSLDQKHLFI